MEDLNEIAEKNHVPILDPRTTRKELNHLGQALLFNTFLQLYVPTLLTLLLLYLETVLYSSKSSIFAILLTIPSITNLLMIVSLIVSESVPFFICARRLKIKLKDLFQAPDLSIKTLLILTVICLGVNTFFSSIVSIIQSLLAYGGLNLTTPDFSLGFGLTNQLLMLFMLVIVAPIGEEFMLRGICLKSLSKYGTKFAIITTSLLFALLHGNFIQGIPTFFMGVILAYVTIKSKSILPSIFIHFINNSFAVSEMLISNTLPYFPIMNLLIFVSLTIYFLYRYRSKIRLENSIPNKKGCWKYFFTSYSIILFIAIYIWIYGLSVTILSTL